MFPTLRKLKIETGVTSLGNNSLLVILQTFFKKFLCKAERCCSVGCQNDDHLAQLDDIHMVIVNDVLYSSRHYTIQVVNNNTFKVISGWNRHVKELYTKSQEDYKKWLVSGRVRDSDEFRKMNMSQKVFKRPYRYVRKMKWMRDLSPYRNNLLPRL